MRRRIRIVARPLTSFLEGPASVRNAIRAIVAVTIGTTVLGGVLMFTFDRQDFPTMQDAMWWSLQTVTTVGYGDITPKSTVGRFIGAAVLLYAVAFLAILTAGITTTFVERAGRERRRAEGTTAAEPRDLGAVLDRLDAISARLDQLEQRLGPGRGDAPASGLGSSPDARSRDA